MVFINSSYLKQMQGDEYEWFKYYKEHRADFLRDKYPDWTTLEITRYIYLVWAAMDEEEKRQ